MPKPARKNRQKVPSVNLARGKPKNNTVVDFNPDDRLQFITGFRKRKNERRKEAEKNLIAKAKEERIAQRKEIREEREKKREEKRELKAILKAQSSGESKIYFAGTVSSIGEVFSDKVPANGNNIKSGSSKNEIGNSSIQRGSVAYQVNNQMISVTTKSIDLNEDIEVDDEPIIPLREESSEEEDNDELMELDNEDDNTRVDIPIYSWNDDENQWSKMEIKNNSFRKKESLSSFPFSCLTLNVWNSDKWQESRTNGLFGLLHEHKADIVCLQEVGNYLLDKLRSNHWIQEYYCITDVYGNLLEDNEFIQIILIKKQIANEKIRKIRLFPFTKTITLRSALFLYLGDLVIVNVHLEGLSNEKIRTHQIEELSNFIENNENVILLGDFSAMNNELPRQTEMLEKFEFSDVWDEINDIDEYSYTFDQEEIIDMLNAKQRKKKNKTQARFDRILIKSENYKWRPESISIIGKDPLPKYNDERVFISTHFGLFAKFIDKKPCILAPIHESNSDEESNE